MPWLGVGGALVIGLALGLLGSGGSIVTVPVLVYLFGQPEKQAIAGSLIVVALVAAFGAVLNARAGTVSPRAFVSLGPTGMAGAWAGATLSQYVSGSIQLLAFSTAMLTAATMMLRPARITIAPAVDAQAPSAPGTLTLAGIGFAVGVLTGFVGVGGGFLILPALVLAARVPMHTAIGTSLMLISLNALAGFAKYLLLLGHQGIRLDFEVLALVALLGMGGTVMGRQVASQLTGPTLRRVFAVALIVIALFIIRQNLAPALTGRQ